VIKMIKLAKSAMLPLDLIEYSSESEITRNVYLCKTNKIRRKPSLRRPTNYDLIMLLHKHCMSTTV